MLCIYCSEDKPKSSFNKREHVIPQAFGKFIPENPVLKECVCDDCNQYFGNEIELFLSRDTFEGIERLRHGLKHKEQLKHRKRLTSKIKDGAWKGVIVREMHSALSSGNTIERVLQAGFYHAERNEYEYFELKDIPTDKKLVDRGYSAKNIRLIAKDGEELNALISKLSEQGISVKPQKEPVNQGYPGEIVPVEIEITVDRTIMRGFCKIALNYLTFVAGKDFVLSPDFYNIRRFIRFDEGDSSHFFKVNLPPILHDDQRLEGFAAKVTEGHIIIVGWENQSVVSKLSLFNEQTYGINLCRDFKGIWRPIKSGHHFDVETKQVNKLMSVSKALMP